RCTPGHRDADWTLRGPGAAEHVRAVWDPRAGQRRGVPATLAVTGAAARGADAATRVAAYRVHPRGTLQPRFLWRWIRRAVAARAVAVPAVRPVSRGGRHHFLLDWSAVSRVVSDRGASGAPNRTGEHDGFYPSA